MPVHNQRGRRLLTLAAVILICCAFQPAAVDPAHAAANGIVTPDTDALVQGMVAVTGVAQAADFAKWQLDLLPAGDADRAVFLAVGETATASAAALTSFDSTPFVDGAYSLRLRVVRRDGNYDEYLTAITIANRAPVPASRPATASAARLVSSRAASLGLPLRTAAGQPILYLTFDDGPTPTLTPQIVELLDRYDAKATFFVVGLHLRRALAHLRPVAEAGHTIANHTFSHRSLVGRDQAAFSQEVEGVEELVRAAVGDLLPADFSLAYLRPPGGGVDANTAPTAAALGYRLVGWDIDPKDWRRPGADVISGTVVRQAFPGAIVLLHDGGGGSQQTVAALETILKELSGQGYVFQALP